MSANMFSQRALQLTARRLAATHPSTLSRALPLVRLSAPAAIATGQNVQYRPAATATPLSPTSASEILNAQRLHRPIAPHLTIYKPQVPWIISGLNRITAVALSGSLYLFGLAYLGAPVLGWHLESASLAASFAALPIIAKIILKAGFAMPFTFHSFNSLRHLVWDTGSAFSNRQVIITGWAMVGASVAAALGLAFL